MRVILFILAAVVWLGAFVYVVGNITNQPSVLNPQIFRYSSQTELLNQPVIWNSIPPQFYHIVNTGTGEGQIEMPISILEWMTIGKKNWRKLGGIIYKSDNIDVPFITEWGLKRDQSMSWSIGSLRFNNTFIVYGLFLIIYSFFCISWLLSDSFQLKTPEEKQRDYDKFIDNVKAMERESLSDPDAFKRKVIQLAASGYCIIFGSVILLSAMGILAAFELFVSLGKGYGAAKIAFLVAGIPLAFSGIMLRALFTDSYRTTGIKVTKNSCPELFQTLDKLCSRLDGPKFKRVYITPFMNASVSRSHGTFGFLGFGPVTLELGIPLLKSLSLKEAVSVIAHEYGHVASHHNAIGQWVYRIRGSWLDIEDRLKFDQLWYVLMLNRFYKWFMDEFSGRSFVLSRQCEYEADTISASLTSKESAGSALVNTEIFGHFYDACFWGYIWKKTDEIDNIHHIRPYFDLWQSYARNAITDEAEIEKLLNDAINRQTHYVSTHPSLADRLKNLGISNNKLNVSFPDKMAFEILGDEGKKICREFDKDWQSENADYWKQKNNEDKAAKTDYETHSSYEMASLDYKALENVKYWAYREKDYATALKCLEEIILRYPDHFDTKIEILDLKLSYLKDDTVLDEIILGAHSASSNRGYYMEILLRYYHDTHQDGLKKKYESLYDNWSFEMDAARDERNFVLKEDQYIPYDISPDIIKELQKCAEEHKVILKLYLARKITKYATDIPSYLFAYKAAPKALTGHVDTLRIQEFINLADKIFPNALFIGVDEVIGLSKKMKEIPNSLIFHRNHWWNF